MPELEKKENTVLIVDGFWNLKRNHFKRIGLKDAQGNSCGGALGFLDSLKSAINRVMPDRVVVMWDGFNAGKLRYEVYKPYKAKRQKNWNLEKKILQEQGYGVPLDSDVLILFRQKEMVQRYLEELSVRQAQVDYIEADDLIGLYCLQSPGQKVVIMSRDGDYLQLVDDNVSFLTPDTLRIVTKENFFLTYGYCVENSLLIKCFEGDKSDSIEGVKGVSTKKLLENFPELKKEKYLYSRLVEEAYKKREEYKGRKKFFDKIINADAELKRNGRLMNLKRPFVNQEAVESVKSVSRGPLNSERRSVQEAMTIFVKSGLQSHIGYGKIDSFFQPYYRIQMKERAYTEYFKDYYKQKDNEEKEN